MKGLHGHRLLAAFATAAILSSLVAACGERAATPTQSTAAPAAGAHVKLDVTSTYPTSLTLVGESSLKTAKRILRASGGEIELKIPQKNIGQVRAAYAYLGVDELDVDLLVTSDPTATYRGKLHINMIAREAVPNRNDNNEPEPVVYARVRLSPKKDAKGKASG